MPLTVGKVQYKEGPDGWAPIFDLGAPTLFADLITEFEEVDGVVRITFAALSGNGDGTQKAIVSARIRLPKHIAVLLGSNLQDLGE